MSSIKIDSQNWEELQELFHLAAEAPEEIRAQVLAGACPDSQLRERVVELLVASNAESVPLTEPIASLGGKIGSYDLIRHLGTW